jgi:multiple sugar transport system ATP-binding protein
MVTLKDGLGAQLADGTIIGIPVGLNETEGQQVTIGMRPEHLQLAGAGIAGEVMVVEPLGMNTQITLTVMGDRLTLMAIDRPKIAPGDPVKLAIAPSNVHVFNKLTGQRIG